jgi:hypothetical protein
MAFEASVSVTKACRPVGFCGADDAFGLSDEVSAGQRHVKILLRGGAEHHHRGVLGDN